MQLNVKYITFLCYLDLKWVAKKLEERGLVFWANTFEHFSECARLMEEDAVQNLHFVFFYKKNKNYTLKNIYRRNKKR